MIKGMALKILAMGLLGLMGFSIDEILWSWSWPFKVAQLRVLERKVAAVARCTLLSLSSAQLNATQLSSANLSLSLSSGVDAWPQIRGALLLLEWSLWTAGNKSRVVLRHGAFTDNTL